MNKYDAHMLAIRQTCFLRHKRWHQMKCSLRLCVESIMAFQLLSFSRSHFLLCLSFQGLLWPISIWLVCFSFLKGSFFSTGQRLGSLAGRTPTPLIWFSSGSREEVKTWRVENLKRKRAVGSVIPSLKFHIAFHSFLFLLSTSLIIYLFLSHLLLISITVLRVPWNQ